MDTPSREDISLSRENLLKLVECVGKEDDVSDLLIYPNTSFLKESEVRYSEFTPLGQGALKEVYRCWDAATQRHVAYAQLRSDRTSKADAELLIHEAWLTSSLNHMSIIRLLDAGIDPQRGPYFTMDLLENYSLIEFTPQAPSLTALLETYQAICHALAYAHHTGILHLDLKPHNIICGDFGEVKVCDWGLGQAISEEGQPSHSAPPQRIANLQSYAGVMGTPGYMAPEQLIKNAPKDQRTDVYGLGSILYYLLTGYSPPTDHPHQLNDIADFLPAPQPISVAPTAAIPAALNAICTKAMSPLPADRYPSVEALQADIQRYLTDCPTHALRGTIVSRSALFIKRHSTLLATATTLFLHATIALFFAHERSKKKQQLDDELMRQTERETYYQVIDKRAFTFLFNYINRNGGMKSFNGAKRLLLEAQTYDRNPKHKQAWLNYLHTIQLNLEAVSGDATIQHSTPFATCFQLKERYPDFAFTQTERPTLEQLREVAEFLLQESPTNAVLLDRILYYDRGCRGAHFNYHPLITALLDTVNEQRIDIQYDPTENHLSLHSETPLVFSTTPQQSFLSYNRYNHLTLSSPVSVSAEELRMAHIGILDLSSAIILPPNKPVRIKGLQEIIVHPDQPNRTELFINHVGRSPKITVK